jgi:hypothetical protein
LVTVENSRFSLPEEVVVQRKLRLAVLVVVVLAALPAATVKAAVRMPVGFFDDPSFRWSAQTGPNLAAAAAAHSSIVHALVNWAVVAPTQPAHPLNGGDPAYHLSDLDALVNSAEKYDLQVLLTITGTPPWANGHQTANHPPTNLNDLTQFAQMLANRYNGTHPGLGVVTRYSIWNEPNLGQFLTPQYQGSKIVSPATYAKLFMAAYQGIKAGNRNALVAAGETSNRGRNRPSGNPGTDSVAPATFAQMVAEAAPKLPLDAWATHPYPTNFVFGPGQKVAYPNVAFSTMERFGAALETWFHRKVPIWVTEYGEMTKPECACGVSYAQQAGDVRKAFAAAAADPYVQMFVWFVFRDQSTQTPMVWFSGLENANGQKKPSYAAFSSAAAGVVGQTQTVAPDHPVNVTISVPFMVYHDPPGTDVGITYTVKHGNVVIAVGQPREPLGRDEQLTFRVKFNPVKGKGYTMTVVVNDKPGQTERHTVALVPPAT